MLTEDTYVAEFGAASYQITGTLRQIIHPHEQEAEPVRVYRVPSRNNRTDTDKCCTEGSLVVGFLTCVQPHQQHSRHQSTSTKC